MASPPQKPRLRPLAELVEGALGDALAKRGFAGSDIVLNWAEIVGEALGKRSEPVKVQWPPRRPGQVRSDEQATLQVRVESAFALELQHRAPIIIERINAYLGWACIGRIRLEQGPVGRGRRAPRAIPQPTPEALAKAGEAAAGIDDDMLKQAVARLGAAVFTGKPKPVRR